jgi:hypothetical protein
VINNFNTPHSSIKRKSRPKSQQSSIKVKLYLRPNDIYRIIPPIAMEYTFSAAHERSPKDEILGH